VRRGAARALGRLGPAAGDAAAGLRKLLGDEDAAVQATAAVALWRIERHAEAIPALEAMLRGGQGGAAYQAAVSLGELGAEAATAAPALADALASRDEDLRRGAAYALGRIGPAAVPAVRRALAHRDESTRRQAVEALGWVGPSAVPVLVEALADGQALVRRAAARALGRLGPAANQATPALLQTASDRDSEVRAAAAEALQQIRGR